MYIGITLLYSSYEKNKLVGLLKSYTLFCPNKSIVLSEINRFGTIQAKLKKCNYLGIDDIYGVSGKATVGEVIGRTSFFELTTIDQASQLNQPLFNLKYNINNNYLYNCKLLYFYQENVNNGFCFEINTIMYGANLKTSKLKNYAMKKSIIYKIIKISLDINNLEKIKYIGVSGVQEIKENINKLGSYSIFYNDEIESEKELVSILPSTEELIEMIDDVYSKHP